MDVKALPHHFADSEQLKQLYDSDLRKGRCFVPGATGFSERDHCIYQLKHPARGAVWQIRAEVVWVSPGPESAGVGLQFLAFTDKEKAGLERYICQAPEVAEGSAGGAATDRKQSPIEKVRGLSQSEQLKLAKQGNLPERVALERALGPSVWEALLSNPRLTPPEVAKIARKGNLPKPLLDQVVANRGWLASGEVRRALLTNPRLQGSAIEAVLKACPAAELKRIPQQTAYTQAVRQAVKRRFKLGRAYQSTSESGRGDAAPAGHVPRRLLFDAAQGVGKAFAWPLEAIESATIGGNPPAEVLLALARRGGPEVGPVPLGFVGCNRARNTRSWWLKKANYGSNLDAWNLFDSRLARTELVPRARSTCWSS